MSITDRPVTLTALTAVKILSKKGTFTPSLCTPGKLKSMKEKAMARK
jgi:hypothetical protein